MHEPNPVNDPHTDANDLPLVIELSRSLTPEHVFSRLADWPHLVWFDSAGGPAAQSRYSIISADPLEWIESDHQELDPWSRLEPFLVRQTADPIHQRSPSRFPLPFQGGIAGVLSYDLCRTLERIPDQRFVDLVTPRLAFGLYDWSIVWDHLHHQVWWIAQGWPESEPGRRLQQAQLRFDRVTKAIHGVTAHRLERPNMVRSSEDVVAPMFPTRFANVESNFSSAQYREAIHRIVQAIRAGDVFQVNLAQRLLIRDTLSPASRYLALRQANRAPFAGYLDGGDWQLLSSSPERLLEVNQDRWVETRPIKGTCPRTGVIEQDDQLAQRLMQNPKDRAENVMIVDLMRNDLSRFCREETVQVSQLCGLEPYARVQHLVSVVRGQMKDEATVLDALKAIYPGGSVTGAPKPQAMQMIAALEPTRRGFYCGAFGYVSAHGRADFNILIRTMTATASGYMQLPVGGGITARSQPIEEEQETWDKAAGMLAAFGV